MRVVLTIALVFGCLIGSSLCAMEQCDDHQPEWSGKCYEWHIHETTEFIDGWGVPGYHHEIYPIEKLKTPPVNAPAILPNRRREHYSMKFVTNNGRLAPFYEFWIDRDKNGNATNSGWIEREQTVPDFVWAPPGVLPKSN